MTELTHETHVLPLPEDIATLAAPAPAMILNSLNENVKHTLSAAFEFVRMAFTSLDEAISPFASEATPDEIFYLTPQELEAGIPVPTPKKLSPVIESAVFITATRTNYTRDCVFFCYKNEKLHRLSAPYQRVLEEVIFKIQGVQYYLDSIDHFWNAPHHFSQLTNKEYMARSMAAQLQCASSVRGEDHSLTLESIDLILRLAHPTLKPNAHFYEVALTQSEHNANIPLIGVFLISTKAEDFAGEVNPCVLYVPGTEIQQFDAIASMKTHLATYLINPTVSPNPLPYCVALSQQSVLRNLTHGGALDERSINLTPVPVSPDFFSHHIQLLIDQQKQDITYRWSQTEFPTPPADLPGFVPRYSINRKAFEFFGDTVKNHAIPILDAWQKNRIPTVLPESPHTVEPEDIPPAITPPPEKILKPIKLHVILHRDLETDWTDTLLGLFFVSSLRTYTFDSIKKDYFSWLADELETLSGRKVEIIQITKEEAPDLYTFDYSSDDSRDSITRWEKAVPLFLQTTSRPPSPLDKFILLTRNAVVPGRINGVANDYGGQFAIATLNNFRTAAHEVGHLLDARHEAGEIIYNGWWSETLMAEYDFFSALRTNAYRFSDQNRERIKNYLKQFD